MRDGAQAEGGEIAAGAPGGAAGMDGIVVGAVVVIAISGNEMIRNSRCHTRRLNLRPLRREPLSHCPQE